jgi:hypothetical protein
MWCGLPLTRRGTLPSSERPRSRCAHAQVWRVDRVPTGNVLARERMDCISADADKINCPNGADTMITHYLRDGTTVQWTIVRSETCSVNYIAGSIRDAATLRASPLRDIRAGHIVNVFTNAVNSSFVERTSVRGVPADTYVAPLQTVVNGGITYRYRPTTYFFPEGWAFPGRPKGVDMADSGRYPMRMKVSGVSTQPSALPSVSCALVGECAPYRAHVSSSPRPTMTSGTFIASSRTAPKRPTRLCSTPLPYRRLAWLHRRRCRVFPASTPRWPSPTSPRRTTLLPTTRRTTRPRGCCGP